MAERTTGLRRLLGLPQAYGLVQRLLGSAAGSERFVRERVRPEVGVRLIDLGCGPGRLLADLPAVDYFGFDPSAAYIDAANESYGDRATFQVGTAGDIDSTAIGEFDLAVARGVLHHLDDDQCREMLELASKVLKPGGRLVTLDPVFVDSQRFISRQLVSRDRGANVRTVDSYAQLVDGSFRNVEQRTYSDLLRIPYDHVSFEATV